MLETLLKIPSPFCPPPLSCAFFCVWHRGKCFIKPSIVVAALIIISRTVQANQYKMTHCANNPAVTNGRAGR